MSVMTSYVIVHKTNADFKESADFTGNASVSALHDWCMNLISNRPDVVGIEIAGEWKLSNDEHAKLPEGFFVYISRKSLVGGSILVSNIIEEKLNNLWYQLTTGCSR
jgi:hypothetical protein